MNNPFKPQTDSSAVFVGTLINNILNEVEKRHTEKLFEGFEKAQAPLVRFFEPFALGNLNNEGAEEAIVTPLKDSNVVFDEPVTVKIIKTTQGQPYYLQEFCYYLFNNAVDGKVTMNVYDASYSNTMNDIATKIWNQRIQ